MYGWIYVLICISIVLSFIYIQFLSHGQPHWFACQFAPSFQWFTCILFMKMVTVSNLCLTCVILSNIYLLWFFWFADNYQWLMPNLYHIIFDQNDGWVVGSPTIIVIIKSFFKDIPNGRMGWSWKGPKVIVAGSLQLDIW